MTQIDLPQISVQRYVELLKRRRWQVIPVSLLGLAIGGIVAFFIPRYFVASSTLVYRQPPGEAAAPYGEDPFEAIVDSARLTIPSAIAATIKSLGWPEGLVTDPFVLSENVAAIEDRLVIGEENTGKNRTFVRIRVTYKDRDGIRAEQFTNTLVGTWVTQRIEEQRAAARERLTTATELRRQQVTAFDKCLDDKLSLEKEYQIDPSLGAEWQRLQAEPRSARLQERIADLVAKKAELQGHETVLARLKAELEGTTQRVPFDRSMLDAQAMETEAGRELVVRINIATLSLMQFKRPSERKKHEDNIAKYKALLAELLAKQPGGAIEVGADGLVLNPAYKKLLAEIAAKEQEIEKLRAVIQPMQTEVDAETARAAKLPGAYASYIKVRQDLEETQKRRIAAEAAVEDATKILGRLDSTPPVTRERPAYAPPRPTDPNIVLVALLGCIVGLLVATGLILLLDVLQGSFKTVDDVERGLPVPVLGGLSYLETAEEHESVRKGRRRITLVAAAFVFLTTGVVLVFYYDPTRLPPFVRELLAMVLGA